MLKTCSKFEFLSVLEDIARKALLCEVETTPKPGLVDLWDNGAHKDMCYQTFVASTEAIVPFLSDMAALGCQWTNTPQALFEAIRPIGMKAESAMFLATKNVNTHKGIIFSLGILMSMTALCRQRLHTLDVNTILNTCKNACLPVLRKDFAAIDPTHPKTHGEALYITHGHKGIRGEVMNGFPSIATYSLPVIRSLKSQNIDDNDIHLQVLLTLMAHVEDSNILSRSNMHTQEKIWKQSKAFLVNGGIFQKNAIDILRQMNMEFIEKNISPGGCADLLAITLYLWELEFMSTMY